MPRVPAVPFTRDIAGDRGGQRRQNITIFAPDLATAERVLAENLNNLLRHTHGTAVNALRASPAWTASEVPLDTAKVVMQFYT